ncbi:MAG: biopolymer transporter ExbD [Campylobacterota bacterium]|nr:biopolymer transporter ExbD [Campylobacterota bacterium]
MYNYDQKPDLNITPLVDVMLVLLAILMVTAPVLEYEENINLPKGSKSKKVQQISKIDIIVNNHKTIIVNKIKYKYINFADSFILFAKDKDRNTPVHIRADRDLKYDDVIYILKTVKEAGFFKVSLITDG